MRVIESISGHMFRVGSISGVVSILIFILNSFWSRVRLHDWANIGSLGFFWTSLLLVHCTSFDFWTISIQQQEGNLTSFILTLCPVFKGVQTVQWQAVENRKLWISSRLCNRCNVLYVEPHKVTTRFAEHYNVNC